MTWTFSPNLPTAKDVVRDYVGDTDSGDQLISDEQITAYLAVETSTLLAAARTAFAISAKFARKVSESVAGSSHSAESKFRQYEQLANRLLEQAGVNGTASAVLVSAWAGGISVSEKEAAEQDTDRVQPIFTRDLFRSPDVSDSTGELDA